VSEPTGRTVLAAESLTKGYPLPSGWLQVLENLSLRVHAGEAVSIRGESGSGKSTLLHLLAGLEAADRGEVLWEGEAIDRWAPARRARERGRRVGMVFQAHHLLPELTAWENVFLAARIAGRADRPARIRAGELLERVGLADRGRQRPAQMSGGERQRVAVARALLNRPALLFADEPTGNLDETTADSVFSLLLQLVREESTALVLVTHSERFAGRCDRSCHLVRGLLYGADPVD
jgi:predicted ABC-type transport system involved in lysophospholipase L1 biosynthesis ATPase subunit